MGFYLRGLLLEYGTDILGPIPNVVVFQFNPDQLERTMEPPRGSSNTGNTAGSSGSTQAAREPHRGGGGPATETIKLTASFDAADDLGASNARSVVPRLFGVGPQLVALERMIKPSGGRLAELIAAGLDAIGDALSGGGQGDGTQSEPPQQMPRILFIWGPSRVLPVELQRVQITEQKFDSFLNPVRAEVIITMKVISAFPEGSTDRVGSGALAYTGVVKDLQQLANLTEAVVDVIPF